MISTFKLLSCLLLTSLTLLADAGGFAQPAEFGSPILELGGSENISPSSENDWHPSGEKPFKAQLTAIEGNWARDALAVLQTKFGRQVKVRLGNLSDEDILTVKKWLTENRFEKIETLFQGTFFAKIEAANRLNPASTEEKHRKNLVFLLRTDGTRELWKFNRDSLSPQEKSQARDGYYEGISWINTDTIKRIEPYLDQPPPLLDTPLPIASSAEEAMLHYFLYQKAIVLLYLNIRGSAPDTVFRAYLAEYPEAAAVWAQRYIFLLAYCSEDGLYPQEVLRAHEDLQKFCGGKLNGSSPNISASYAATQALFGNIYSQYTTGFHISFSEFRKQRPLEIGFGLY